METRGRGVPNRTSTSAQVEARAALETGLARDFLVDRARRAVSWQDQSTSRGLVAESLASATVDDLGAAARGREGPARVARILADDAAAGLGAGDAFVVVGADADAWLLAGGHWVPRAGEGRAWEWHDAAPADDLVEESLFLDRSVVTVASAHDGGAPAPAPPDRGPRAWAALRAPAGRWRAGDVALVLGVAETHFLLDGGAVLLRHLEGDAWDWAPAPDALPAAPAGADADGARAEAPALDAPALDASRAATLEASRAATLETSHAATLDASRAATLETSHAATLDASQAATLETSLRTPAHDDDDDDDAPLFGAPAVASSLFDSLATADSEPLSPSRWTASSSAGATPATASTSRDTAASTAFSPTPSSAADAQASAERFLAAEAARAATRGDDGAFLRQAGRRARAGADLRLAAEEARAAAEAAARDLADAAAARARPPPDGGAAAAGGAADDGGGTVVSFAVDDDDDDVVARVTDDDATVASHASRGSLAYSFGGLSPGRTRIFRPTSMCAYSTVSTRGFLPRFENPTRAIDSSKNQPNRLRFDRGLKFGRNGPTSG